MRTFTSLILILFFSLALAGCQEKQKKKPDVPIEGIKITDIMPTYKEKTPAAINLQISTFHIPVSNYGIFSAAFNSLRKDRMRFSNYKSFHTNGFEAGIGNTMAWDMIRNTFRNAGARRARLNTLIVYDELGDDFLTGKITSETKASYFTLDGKDTETILAPGHLGWKIKSRILTKRRGLAQLKIQGIYKRYLDSMFSRLPKYDNGEIIFKPSTMIMELNEGEFVLLGPDPKTVSAEINTDEDDYQYGIESVRLADLFFRTTAKIIIPKTTDGEQDPENPEETIYRPARDIPVIEIYCIACIGVEN